MQNAAFFMDDRGVWHMDCVVALSFIPRKVCFKGLRLTSVKWDKKTVLLSSQTPTWLKNSQTLSRY